MKTTGVLFCLVALGFLACSGPTKVKGGGKREPPSPEASAPEGAVAPATTPTPNPAPAPAPAPAPSPGEPDGGEEDGAIDEPGPTLEEVLEECGAPDLVDGGDEDKVIYEKELKSLPIVKTVLVIKATVETMLKVKVTGKSTVQDAKVQVTKLEGLFAELARPVAEKEAAALTGITTLTNLPFSSYGDLAQHKTYARVICSFVPATAIDNRRGGKKTIATFDPPLPASVSPKAAAARYLAEIGTKGRTFRDIKATVTESDDPELAGKKEVLGTVEVTPVDPKPHKADAAFRMRFHFESPKITFALGLPPSVIYYISHAKKDLVANEVDTTDAGGGVAVFLHP